MFSAREKCEKLGQIYLCLHQIKMPNKAFAAERKKRAPAEKRRYVCLKKVP